MALLLADKGMLRGHSLENFHVHVHIASPASILALMCAAVNLQVNGSLKIWRLPFWGLNVWPVTTAAQLHIEKLSLAYLLFGIHLGHQRWYQLRSVPMSQIYMSQKTTAALQLVGDLAWPKDERAASPPCRVLTPWLPVE
jgi:hypothetical protein